jgi:2-polyprenyl-6-methoxyphenol hydroxylase-like FAD-dependent oxidoreductase
MNTGIQDATNLAWKVALAAAGDVASAPQLLQTYQEERHPAGEDAVRLSGVWGVGWGGERIREGYVFVTGSLRYAGNLSDLKVFDSLRAA